MKESRFQKFTAQTIKRNEIQLADYNPRLIDPVNKKLLRKGIKEHGLVEPLVWNRRTGRLVSGHQRLSIMDSLEKTKDYSLTVSVIDVDEREEKILNVQLNNASMQGVFDVQMLGDLALDTDISLEELGFTDLDAETMFGGEEKYQALFDDPPAVSEAKDKLKEFKKTRETLKQEYAKDATVEEYMVLTFSSPEQARDFRETLHIPESERSFTFDRLYQWMQSVLSDEDEDDEYNDGEYDEPDEYDSDDEEGEDSEEDFDSEEDDSEEDSEDDEEFDDSEWEEYDPEGLSEYIKALADQAVAIDAERRQKADAETQGAVIQETEDAESGAPSAEEADAEMEAETGENG